jgi:multiple sugar transport system permease protein
VGTTPAKLTTLAQDRVTQQPIRRLFSGTTVLAVVLLAVAILWLMPLVWIVLTAFKPPSETIQLPIRLLPSRVTLENFETVLTTSRTANLARAFLNSVIVATVQTVLVLTLCSMAGYALARLRFRGRNIIFAIIIASLVVPAQITLVPMYLMFQKLGWLSTYQALFLPGLAEAFGVFLMRQFFLAIPRDLEDAARMDGAGIFTIFARIALPQVQPALAALGLFTFLASWNAFTWPLIVISRNDRMTLPVALARLIGSFSNEYGVIMAGAVIAAVPLLVVFLFAQRRIIEGIAMTGLKE